MHNRNHALPPLWVLLLTLAFPIGAAATDAVEGMCLDRDRSETVCSCAAERLRSEVDDADYALYEEVGRVYRQQLEQGQGMGDAWNAGIAAAASERNTGTTTILKQTNSIGRTHRQMMKDCK